MSHRFSQVDQQLASPGACRRGKDPTNSRSGGSHAPTSSTCPWTAASWIAGGLRLAPVQAEPDRRLGAEAAVLPHRPTTARWHLPQAGWPSGSQRQASLEGGEANSPGVVDRDAQSALMDCGQPDFITEPAAPSSGSRSWIDPRSGSGTDTFCASHVRRDTTAENCAPLNRG